MRPLATPSIALAAAALLAATSPAVAASTCTARSGATAPVVVELYTSEGCSSCPPADRWLSSLKGRAGVLPLAFHVDYWDRLGWPDRFASPAMTQRQHEWARLHRSATVYTPQVIVNGQDWRRWPDLPSGSRSSDIVITLTRDGDQVRATVEKTSQPNRLAGYWAVLEDQHVSRVSAGENRGETLHHDHIVRHYQPVAAWTADQPREWTLPVLAGVKAHPRRVAFVVVDAQTQRPLQALTLDC